MKKENGWADKGDPSLSLEKVLIELGVPKKNELSVQDVFRSKKKYLESVGDLSIGIPEECADILTFIKKDIGEDNLTVRGPVEIARGQRLILEITPAQRPAFDIIFGLDEESPIDYHASVETADVEPKKVVDVLVKFGHIKSKLMDNIIVSEALAKELDVKADQHIIITSIYQRTSDVDLDELE